MGTYKGAKKRRKGGVLLSLEPCPKGKGITFMK